MRTNIDIDDDLMRKTMLAEVMAWVLGDEDAGWGLWGKGTRPDPLDEYRL